jgi:hypothetical protein
MSRHGFVAFLVLGVLLAASVAARPGIYEYFKAGTKRSRTKAALPRGHGRAHDGNVASPGRPGVTVVPWSDDWFADSTLVRRRVADMTEALTIPMIGQTFPLPRGGGFVCTRVEGGDGVAAGGLACVIECTGPELGGRRHNWFYASDADPAPTLDRVRWVIVAPAPAPRERWRALVAAVADSLSRAMGPPTWIGPDRMAATWNFHGRTTTMRLHGAAERVDSLDMESVSERLGTRGERARTP